MVPTVFAKQIAYQHAAAAVKTVQCHQPHYNPTPSLILRKIVLSTFPTPPRAVHDFDRNTARPLSRGAGDLYVHPNKSDTFEPRAVRATRFTRLWNFTTLKAAFSFLPGATVVVETRQTFFICAELEL